MSVDVQSFKLVQVSQNLGYITSIMEKHMENNMENEMEAGVYRVYRVCLRASILGL